MFDYLKKPRDLTGYNLMMGATDYGNEVQFNMYEKGYAALFVVKMPRYLEKLADAEPKYATLVNNYKHILEREFKSLSGLSDISADALDINDGVNTLNVIGKVNNEGSREFTLSYNEKSGSPITRLHELYLTGIRDPRAGQVKHYHGLIEKGIIDVSDVGYENETFTFLYINTDNTMRAIEKAYLIVGAYITNANLDMYNHEKGQVDLVQVDVTFNGFPLSSNAIDKKAQEYLDWLHNPKNPSRIIVDSTEFNYTGIDQLNPKG